MFVSALLENQWQYKKPGWLAGWLVCLPREAFSGRVYEPVF
jgi:hypothetical protein